LNVSDNNCLIEAYIISIAALAYFLWNLIIYCLNVQGNNILN